MTSGVIFQIFSRESSYVQKKIKKQNFVRYYTIVELKNEQSKEVMSEASKKLIDYFFLVLYSIAWISYQVSEDVVKYFLQIL